MEQAKYWTWKPNRFFNREKNWIQEYKNQKQIISSTVMKKKINISIIFYILGNIITVRDDTENFVVLDCHAIFGKHLFTATVSDFGSMNFLYHTFFPKSEFSFMRLFEVRPSGLSGFSFFLTQQI